MTFDQRDKLIFTLMLAISDLLAVYYMPSQALGFLLASLGLFKLIGVKRTEFVPLAIAAVLLNASQPYTVILLAIATAFAWVPYSYSFFITMGISILTINLDSTFQFLSLLSLLIMMRYFNLEVRGFLVSGIALLVYSAINLEFAGPLGDVAYFDLLMGVIGVASETSLGKRSKVVLQYVALGFPSLVFALLGLPKSLYYLETGSFVFELNPFNLWFPGVGYFPLMNQFFLLFIEKHFVGWASVLFVPVMAYLASLFSFLAFKSLGLRPPIVWAVLYGLLTPYWAPQLILPYVAIPGLFLMINKLRNRTLLITSAMAVTTLMSSSVSFPFLVPFVALLGQRKDLFFPLIFASLGATAFWLIPYLSLGYSEAYYLSFPIGLVALILALSAVIANEGRDRYVPIIALASGLFMLLDFQYSLSVFPLFVFSLILSSAQVVERKLAMLKGLVLASLIALTAFSIISYSHAPPASYFSGLSSIRQDPLNFVYWVGQYNLSSPNLLSNLTYSYYVVEENNSGVNVTVHEPSPYVVTALPYVRPNAEFSVKPFSMSEVTLVNYSGIPVKLLWTPTIAPGYPTIFLTFQHMSELETLHVVANYSNIKAIFLLYNGSSTAENNISDLEVPKGSVGLYLSASVNAETSIEVTQIYGTLSNGSTIIYLGLPENVTLPKVSYEVVNNGLVIRVASNITFTLMASVPDNYTVLVFKGTEYRNLSAVLSPGIYEVLVQFKYSYLELYGAIVTAISYAVALAQGLIVSFLTRVWKILSRKLPKSS